MLGAGGRLGAAHRAPPDPTDPAGGQHSAKGWRRRPLSAQCPVGKFGGKTCISAVQVVFADTGRNTRLASASCSATHTGHLKCGQPGRIRPAVTCRWRGGAELARPVSAARLRVRPASLRRGCLTATDCCFIASRTDRNVPVQIRSCEFHLAIHGSGRREFPAPNLLHSSFFCPVVAPGPIPHVRTGTHEHARFFAAGSMRTSPGAKSMTSTCRDQRAKLKALALKSRSRHRDPGWFIDARRITKRRKRPIDLAVNERELVRVGGLHPCCAMPTSWHRHQGLTEGLGQQNRDRSWPGGPAVHQRYQPHQ